MCLGGWNGKRMMMSWKEGSACSQVNLTCMNLKKVFGHNLCRRRTRKRRKNWNGNLADFCFVVHSHATCFLLGDLPICCDCEMRIHETYRRIDAVVGE
jgi:hypothetical protein